MNKYFVRFFEDGFLYSVLGNMLATNVIITLRKAGQWYTTTYIQVLQYRDHSVFYLMAGRRVYGSSDDN